MPASAFVIVDPRVLVVPDIELNEEQIGRLFRTAVAWANFDRRDGSVQMLQHSDTLKWLADEKRFPALPDIEAMLELTQLSAVFDARMLNDVILTILDRTPLASDVLGYEAQGVLDTISEPEEFLTEGGPILSLGAQLAAATLALERERSGERCIMGVASEFGGIVDRARISCTVSAISGQCDLERV